MIWFHGLELMDKLASQMADHGPGSTGPLVGGVDDEPDNFAPKKVYIWYLFLSFDLICRGKRRC